MAKLLLTQIFFGPKRFLDQKYFYLYFFRPDFLYPKLNGPKFWDPECYEPNFLILNFLDQIFLYPKCFGTKNFFGPTIGWTQIFFHIYLFYIFFNLRYLFRPEIFGLKTFWTQIFLLKIFWTHICFFTSNFHENSNFFEQFFF